MKKFVSYSKSLLGLRNRNSAVSRAHDSEFAALFYIRNINVELDKDLSQVLQILKGLEHLNTKSRRIFETHCSFNEKILWEEVLNDINEDLTYVDQQLNYLKGNIVNKINLNSLLFWEYYKVTIDSITEEYIKLKQIGFHILPEIEKQYFRSAVTQVQEETLTAIVARISICKQQCDFIIKNTPLHIASVNMQNMIKNIPTSFTLDEAQKYDLYAEKSHLIYKNDFKKRNRFLQSFLNLLPKIFPKSSAGNMMLDK